MSRATARWRHSHAAAASAVACHDHGHGHHVMAAVDGRRGGTPAWKKKQAEAAAAPRAAPFGGRSRQEAAMA